MAKHVASCVPKSARAPHQGSAEPWPAHSFEAGQSPDTLLMVDESPELKVRNFGSSGVLGDGVENFFLDLVSSIQMIIFRLQPALAA